MTRMEDHIEKFRSFSAIITPDAKGILVISLPIQNQTTTSRIDISKLNPGVYSLKIDGVNIYQNPKKLVILR